MYNPRLYVLLMYLVASRDYSREDMCTPSLLIVEVWTGLSPMVFPFTLGGFPCKNYGVWFFFFVAWVYLFITTSCYCSFNFAQRNGRKFLLFVGILSIHPNIGQHENCFKIQRFLAWLVEKWRGMEVAYRGWTFVVKVVCPF